jgi:hypothetical protein
MAPTRDFARLPNLRHDYARRPRWTLPGAGTRQPSFGEFVLLSLLLHILGILLFGSTSGSGVPGGRSLFGDLSVTLAKPAAAPGIGLRLDRGGDLAVKGTPQRTRPESRKEALPRVAPEAKNLVDKPVAPAVPKTEPVPEAAPLPVPAIEAPRVPAPAIEPLVSPTVVRELAAPVELRASEVPLAPARTLQPISPPAVARELAAPTELRASDVPLVPARTLERITPPTVTRELAAPVELRASDVPLVPAQTLERLAPPRLERELVAPVEARPSDVPLVPAQTLERIAPPRIERELVAPVEARPSDVPLVPAQTLERVAPAPQVRELAPTPADLAPRALSTQPATERQVITAPPSPGRSRTAPPDVVDDPFSSPFARPPAASMPAEGAPRLDLEAMRQRAREITREGTGQRAILPMPMPGKPAQKSKEQLAIEQAWKPDCKTAYSGMGLLAMIPLMMNAFGEGTCSWNR